MVTYLGGWYHRYNLYAQEIVVAPTLSDSVLTMMATSIQSKAQFPPDPFCFQLFVSDDFADYMNAYFDKIGLDDESINIGDFKDFFGFSPSTMGEPMAFKLFTTQKFSWTWGNPVTDNLGLSYFRSGISSTSHYKSINEYQNATFKYSGATRILTENQIRQVEQYGKFDGMEVDEKNKQIKSIRYDLLKTRGFYQLRNVVSGIQDIFNVYMFVGDASSPRSLYKINNGDDAEADVNVSDSLFLANDTMLFKNEKGDVGSCNLNSVYLPESVQDDIEEIFNNQKINESQRPAYWNKWEMWFNTNLVYQRKHRP